MNFSAKLIRVKGQTSRITLCKQLIGITVISCAAIAVAQDNLLYNGNFELGDVGYACDFARNNIVSAPEPQHAVANNSNVHPYWPAMTDHTSGSGKMGLFNSGQTNQLAYGQMVHLMEFIPYKLNGAVATLAGGSGGLALPILNFRIEDDLVLTLPCSTTLGQWSTFSVPFSVDAHGNFFMTIYDTGIWWAGSDFALDDLQIQPAHRVNGWLHLAGFNEPLIGRVFNVEIWQNGMIVETLTSNFGLNGTFAFSPNSNGESLVKFQFHTGLWKTVSLNLNSTPYSEFTVDLINGDCDGDNEVTLVDFGILASVFGKSVGDPGYDSQADLDGDDEITLVDNGILASSFGATGD